MRKSTKGATKGLVLRRPEFKKFPQAFRAFYSVFVSNAIARDIPIQLTPEQVHALITRDCHYCGAPPAPRVFGSMRYVGMFNGIDRLNSDGAYDEENAVPACKICNRIKYVSTVEEYLAHAKRIVEFNKK